MANYLNQQLQDFARAAGAVYQGDGMGLHHFKELSTNSNFSLRIPPAESRECITTAKILTRAQEVRKSYGKPEPELPTWETTGTASVGAGSTARRRRPSKEDEDCDLPIDLIESIAEIPSTNDADEPSGYMLDGNDLIALQQTASGEAADSEVQSWLEECGLIADGQVTPHGQRILDGDAAH